MNDPLPDPPLRPSTLLLRATAVALCAALTACSSAGSGGVHVLVTLDAASFGSDLLFDHVTVRAEGAGKRATVCLFPDDEVEREVELDDPDGSCADVHSAIWTGAPALDRWDLEGAPRTINFVFEEGDAVAITASARLGGEPLAVAAGGGDAVADPGYPRVTIALDPGKPAIGAACGAALEAVQPGLFSLQQTGFCEAPAGACPFVEQGEVRASGAMYCAANASRVRNGPGLVCAGSEGGAAVVWHDALGEAAGGCVDVHATGHFVRCASGDPGDPGGCPLTTDCIVPETAFSVMAGGGLFDTVSFACIPPFAIPVTFSVQLRMPEGGEAAVGLVQEVQASGGGACFFDLYSIAVEPVTCAGL